MKKKISITLDNYLLLKIDEIKELESRSMVINNLVAWALDFHPAEQFLKKNDWRRR